jgi:hypothetical protein
LRKSLFGVAQARKIHPLNDSGMQSFRISVELQTKAQVGAFGRGWDRSYFLPAGSAGAISPPAAHRTVRKHLDLRHTR